MNILCWTHYFLEEIKIKLTITCNSMCDLVIATIQRYNCIFQLDM